MKKLVIVFIVSIISSCIVEKNSKSTEYRIIKNNSNYEVNIIINSNESVSYPIAKGDSLVFEGFCEYGVLERCIVGWNETNPISGKVIFDNEKVLIYENDDCENGQNPFGQFILATFNCGYKVRTNEGRVEYVYYIEDSDYERAVPIED